jgi:ethanolamine utilization protein EutN
MQIGLVLGSATATIKHRSFDGERMLVVQLQTRDGRDEGEPVLAFDLLGAAKGDRVILTSDGQILQERLGRDTPGRWSVMGVPDPARPSH